MHSPKKVTRQEAIKLGLKRFYGNLCKVCGSDEKYVCNSYCTLCSQRLKLIDGRKRRARNREWLNQNFFSKGCFYCKKYYHPLVMQIEHPKPIGKKFAISKNGIQYTVARPEAVGNVSIERLEAWITENKLVPSCANCNYVKSRTLDKGTPEGKREWRKYLNEIRTIVRRYKNKNSSGGKNTAKRTSARSRYRNLKS
jgi:hypothetical protein